MTKSSSSSVVSSTTTTKKCKKPCQSSSSSSSCCTVQCIDCCTPQFIRLNRFATFIVELQLTDNQENEELVEQNKAETNPTNPGEGEFVIKNRCGIPIPAPGIDLSPTPYRIGDAYYQTNSGCTSGPFAPTPLNDNKTYIAEAAYYFVNEFAYGPYEPGCHNDQVWGWYVNIETGELQLFTQTDGVPTNATRLCLSNQDMLSSTEKKQLKVLNKLYKLTKSAVKEIEGIPSQEGNIVEVCDCKGQRWLLYINTAHTQNGSPLASCNYQFAVVATKLC